MDPENPMTETPAHVALTLDGSVDDLGSLGAMRWIPPEQAAAIRDADRRAIADARIARRMNDREIPPARYTRRTR